MTNLAAQETEFFSHLSTLVDSLDYFKLGEEALAPSEAEITILIPREEVDNDLEPFAKELQRLNRILEPFVEVVVGSRPPIPVRSISSSQFNIFLLAIPTVAAEVGRAVSRVLGVYQQILDIRKSRGELEAAGVGEDILRRIDQEAANRMSQAIEPMITEILGRAVQTITLERKNELTKDLRTSLNGIANRIDKGYNIDVRMGEPEPPASDEERETESENEALYQEIRRLSDQLQFAPRPGKPILHLPESTDPDEGNGSVA
jgi:hypothetical protein